MKKTLFMCAGMLLIFNFPGLCKAQVDTKWKIHDPDRPVPPVIDPGTASTQDAPGRPPSDAVVLFDGKDLSRWAHKDGSAAKWKVENGYAEVVAKTGYIYTREAFGDCQLHVEFAEPVLPKGESQERGNSGVFLMGLYEIQVLDSYQNKTYADGQAAAVYGQYPPMVNASRPPGQWQSYDIVFHGPRFAKDGKLLRPARVTVLHDGVLVQDNVELTGPTAHGARPPYSPHAEKLPLALQDHGNPVRYRNIWIRELKTAE
jgi:3-keto-disaccharide hydrolase